MDTENTKNTENTKIYKRPHCKFGVACHFYNRFIYYKSRKEDMPSDITMHFNKYFHIPLICQGHKVGESTPECARQHYYNDLPKGKFLCRWDMKCYYPNCKHFHGWKCKIGDKCQYKYCVKWHPKNGTLDGKLYPIKITKTTE